jgi:branched-chain amino acid transport system substrate-binding protein
MTFRSQDRASDDRRRETEETNMTANDRPRNPSRRKVALTTLVAGAAALAAPRLSLAQARPQQYFGLPSYRVGPFGAAGSGTFGGIIDYLTYINMTGGVNGVELIWQECETEYIAARGIECYHRLLTYGPHRNIIFEPFSTPMAYGLMARLPTDRVVIPQFLYGRSDAADGRVFPWMFTPMTNYWSGASAMINWIASREGGPDSLRGKTIVHLYLDNAYGREPLPVFRPLAAKLGFTLRELPVAVPGLEQGAQWLQIRRENPDWVIFWGFGHGMSSTGLTSAARVGFPRERMLGIWWVGAEEDVVPAGPAATGFFAATTVPGGRDFAVVREIERVVYGAGRGNLADPRRIGGVFWNRGVAAAAMWIEALRNAQARFGMGQVMDGEQVRWGFENINLTDARLRELGLSGMMPPMRLTCEDHEGAGVIKVGQWDGSRWVTVTPDWVSSDRPFIRAMVEESAARYAAANNITPRVCPT